MKVRRLLFVVLLFALTSVVYLEDLAVPDSNARAATTFKQEQRLNSLALQYATDAFAPNNRFGSAITGSLARTGFQTTLDTGIADGATSLLLRMLGLNDLSGTNEPSLVVGVVNGVPILPSGNPATYDGTSDLDWWYSQDPLEIDVNAIPKVQLTGSIVSKALAVGPGSMLLNDSLTGPLALSSARIAATVGAVSTPLTSSNGFPPGHLPSELVPPTLQSFGSMSAGKLAGNISAASLAAALIPVSLATGGSASCTEAYSPSNTWLDLLVGGCHVFFLTQTVPAQPDQVDPGAPVAGAGGPYTLTRTGNSVSGCKDKNSAVVSLNACLNAAAYSAYFQFTSDRVIVPGPATPTSTATSTPTLTSTPTATNTPLPLPVGGIAEQPDVAARPSAATSSGRDYTPGVIVLVAVAGIVVSGWYVWRKGSA